jgi:hypothetical protein
VTDKLTEMWAALEAHKPKRSYAKAWRVMCRERTASVAWAAYDATPIGAAAAEAAARWALTAVEAQAMTDRYAQKAIDALREVKP